MTKILKKFYKFEISNMKSIKYCGFQKMNFKGKGFSKFKRIIYSFIFYVAVLIFFSVGIILLNCDNNNIEGKKAAANLKILYDIYHDKFEILTSFKEKGDL